MVNENELSVLVIPCHPMDQWTIQIVVFQKYEKKKKMLEIQILKRELFFQPGVVPLKCNSLPITRTNNLIIVASY